MTPHREESGWRRIATLYRVFGPYVVPYKRQIVLAYFALAFSAGTAALRPWPLKFILDGVILRKKTLHQSIPELPAWIDAVRAEWLVLSLCVLLILIVTAESAAGYLQKVLFARVGHRATTDILEQTFTHLQTLPRRERFSQSG